MNNSARCGNGARNAQG
jgi:hypothetical protein